MRNLANGAEIYSWHLNQRATEEKKDIVQNDVKVWRHQDRIAIFGAAVFRLGLIATDLIDGLKNILGQHFKGNAFCAG